MLGPRLADESAHVDETRSDDVAPAVDDPRFRRKLVACDRAADAGDDAVHDDEPAARFRLPLGVDEAGVEKAIGGLQAWARAVDYRAAPVSASRPEPQPKDIRVACGACLPRQKRLEPAVASGLVFRGP